MARGGRRSGTPGTAYPNRTDLSTPKPLPVTAATGQPYGAAGEQRAAQATVPMGPPPAPAQAAATPSPPPVTPGSFGDFGRPTERPNEPLDATPPGFDPAPTLGALLNQLGRTSPAVAQLAAYVQSGKT